MIQKALGGVKFDHVTAANPSFLACPSPTLVEALVSKSGGHSAGSLRTLTRYLSDASYLDAGFAGGSALCCLRRSLMPQKRLPVVHFRDFKFARDEIYRNSLNNF